MMLRVVPNDKPSRVELRSMTIVAVPLAAAIVSVVAVVIGVIVRQQSNAPLADPIGLGAFVVSVLRADAGAIALGSVHLAYVVGLAVLAATLLLMLGRATARARDAFAVGALVGVASGVSSLPDAADKAGLTGLMFAIPSALAEAVLLGFLAILAWRFERRFVGR